MKKLLKAFTLVELLVIVSVVSALLLIGVSAYTPQLRKARDAKRKTDLYTLAKALEEYEKDNEVYPSSLTQCGVTTSGSPLEDYISQVPCDPKTDTNYAYEVGPSVANPTWFRIYSLLENSGDEDIGQVGCSGGCGPGGSFNYYVSSPNGPGLTQAGVFPTLFPTPTGGPGGSPTSIPTSPPGGTSSPTPTTGPGSPTPRPSGTITPTNSPYGPIIPPLVPPLPADNLVLNPWFRDLSDLIGPSMQYWTVDFGTWSATYKWHNPSPDNLGDQSHTAADISAHGPPCQGVDCYFHQVVSANPSNKTLKFQIYWITIMMDENWAVIYGGNSVSGPWTEVWQPFHVYNTHNLGWRQSGPSQTTIATGYSYYKIVLHARSEAGGGDNKLTGVYFAVAP